MRLASKTCNKQEIAVTVDAAVICIHFFPRWVKVLGTKDMHSLSRLATYVRPPSTMMTE